MKLTERKIETLAVEKGGKDRLVFDDAQRAEDFDPAGYRSSNLGIVISGHGKTPDNSAR